MEEFNSRYTTNRGVFLKNSKKSTLLVKLKDMADFHTLGTRGGPNLPLFFFTQIGPSRWETNWRLAVQAVSIEGMINVDTLFQVVAIRGLPDCCHTTSAILPIILNHLQANIEVEFLPVITTVPIVRRHGLGEKAEDLRVEELIIRVYIKNSTNTKRNEIRDQLQSGQIPAQFDLGSWVGQIADGHTWFEFSPTNTPALLHTSFVLFIEGLSGSPSDDLDYLQQYFSDKTEFASIGYIRGAIDSPTYANPADVLLLFPTSAGGGMIVFDDEGWERDHPADQLGSHVLLPGFISLHRNYRINPQVPEGVYFHPNEQKRPGGAFVQKLVRWNEVQEVLPVIRSGEMHSGRDITKNITREKTVNRSRVEELATGESSRTITTSTKEPGRDLIPARNGEEVLSEPSEGTSALVVRELDKEDSSRTVNSRFEEPERALVTTRNREVGLSSSSVVACPPSKFEMEFLARMERSELAAERALLAAAKDREENAKARAEAAVKGDAMMAFLVQLSARMDANDQASKGKGSL